MVEDKRPAKKRKTASPLPREDEGAELSSSLSELEDAPKAKGKRKVAPKTKQSVPKSSGVASRAKAKAKPTVQKDSMEDEEAEEVAETKTKSGNQTVESESELSSLVDEDEAPKKRRKSKDPSDRNPKNPPKSSAVSKTKPQTEDDPDTAEVKRLQGWLVKCGIRKLWGKELKPYETSKQKIKHLRDMLTEAGMSGRYSVEKAAQIKEARELAADIEAVKEGNVRWGMGKPDPESDSGSQGRAKRTLARGPKTYDFLSSGGEETD